MGRGAIRKYVLENANCKQAVQNMNTEKADDETMVKSNDIGDGRRSFIK